MRSDLPEEIDKIYHHNLISDSTLTVPHIQLCLEDMMQEMDILAADAPTSGVTSSPIRLWFAAPELGHLLIDDNYEGGPYTHWWARFFVNIYPGSSFPAQNGECFKNVRNKSHSLDDREHGCPVLSQPEETECASQRRAIYRCDFPRIAAGKTIFLHLGPPQRCPHRRYDR